MDGIVKKIGVLVILVSLVYVSTGIKTVAANGAQVTSGAFQTYAAGLERGYDITGFAQMVRTANKHTLTFIQVWGLAPYTTCPVHVHNLPCEINDGGGHYQDVVGSPVDNVNEIWPGFTTNVVGHGIGYAANDFIARPEAQSVVIHDGDGARIACANLD
jgi:hypothetical protein